MLIHIIWGSDSLVLNGKILNLNHTKDLANIFVEMVLTGFLTSDGSGTKNPGTGQIRVVLFRVPGRPGTRINRAGRIRVK